jgi:hypothetical protein
MNTINPDEFIRMCDNVRGDGWKVPQSLIVRALLDDRLEIRIVATILAKRRGIQIVKDTQ